ncbi:NUDIX hydrolase [Paenibacillus riograndensis]|uniref:NUDIX hydrolase n=1 Tax=Paenibacillus riograndensis TaxID=483937 RepID=A0A132U7B0_9BACL|nr:NUDIX domain-containing protein [Paenibacillus riograndensis]KWX79348.1 NUDIX hydrolase [Paenibacillus riograndensis]
MPEFRLLSVVHTALLSDQQILLLRRCNTGHDDGFYGLPSGRLDGGEQLDEAAARELQEECGAAVHLKDLKMLGVMHIKTTDDERVDFFFTANRWQGEIVNAEPDKCDDLRWFPINHLPGNMIPFVKQALEHYREGVWFSSHGWE